jgi:hypothetical protein
MLSVANSKAQMPSYREVVYKFFGNYSIENNDVYPLFQKKKEGWFVAEGHYSQPPTYTNPQLFWSAKNQHYQPLNYINAITDTAAVTESISNYWKTVGGDYEEYNFARNTYYGYPGWDWDVINKGSRGKMESDTLLESLGRACSNYASGFVIEQYGNHFENNDPDRSILPDSVAISAERIKKFISYERKCWEAYKKLLTINPDYQTMVGNVALKLANEHLFLYSDLLMAGDRADALKALQGVHYSDSILQLYTLCLNSVAKNALLFTGGDNDTYVMWYLQEAKGVRKDVIVININLLGLRRYVKMLDKSYNGNVFSTKSDVYYKNNFDYYQFSDIGVSLPVEAGEFVNYLNHYNFADTVINKLPNQVYNGEKMKRYYTTKVFFKQPGTEGILKNMQHVISLPINYLSMNQFMLIDIINTNLGKRPIYFTYSEPLVSNLLEAKDYSYSLNLNADEQ